MQAFSVEHVFTTRAATLTFMLACATPLLSGETVPDITTVRSSYHDTVSSIPSISYSNEVAVAQQENGQQRGNAITSYNINVARSLNRRLFDARLKSASSGSEIHERILFDGRAYTASTDKFARDGKLITATKAIISKEMPIAANLYLTVEKAMGESVAGGGASLLEVLEKGRCSVFGWEKVEGVDCVRVDCGTHPLTYQMPRLQAVTTVWLSPDHGYLPRRIRSEHVNAGPNDPLHVRQIDVSTFEHCSTEENGGRRQWIPTSFTLSNPIATATAKVTNVRIALELPESAFAVPLRPGTQVEDRTKAQQSIAFVGGKEARALLVSQVRDTTTAMNEPMLHAATASVVKSARPTDNLSGWWKILPWVGGGSLAAAFLATVCRRKLSRPRLK